MVWLAVLACVLLSLALPSASDGDFLEAGDECVDGGHCAWSLLQRRSTRRSEVQDPTFEADVEHDPALDGGYFFDPPDGWIEEDELALRTIDRVQNEANETARRLLGPTPLGNCSSRPATRDCFLYSACKGRKYCVMGYLIAPGVACAGTEEITTTNAASYDYLFDVAYSQCPIGRCVYIVNPQQYRTEEQLHIHFRHYNGIGARVRNALHKAVCERDGWVKWFVSDCSSGMARRYAALPRVFTEVLRLYGSESLAHTGILVWPDACGPEFIVQTIVGCSVEYAITGPLLQRKVAVTTEDY